MKKSLVIVIFTIIFFAVLLTVYVVNKDNNIEKAGKVTEQSAASEQVEESRKDSGNVDPEYDNIDVSKDDDVSSDDMSINNLDKNSDGLNETSAVPEKKESEEETQKESEEETEENGEISKAEAENPTTSSKPSNTPDAAAAPESSATTKPTNTHDTAAEPEPSETPEKADIPESSKEAELAETSETTESPEETTSETPETMPEGVATSDLKANIDWIVENLGLTRTSDKTAMYNPRNNSIHASLFSIGYDPREVFKTTMLYKGWNGTPLTPWYKEVKPISKKLFKFYFPTEGEKFYNIIHGLYRGEGEEYMEKILYFDNRAVYLGTTPQLEYLQIYIGDVGRKIVLNKKKMTFEFTD